MRISSRKLRVGIGLAETAGYYSSLSRGFAELVDECSVLWIHAHPFRYAVEEPCGVWSKAWLEVARKTDKARVWDPRIAANLAARAALLPHLVRNFDLVILGGGESFFRGLDLPLLKRFVEKVVCIFHGSDSRPPYINGKGARARTGKQLARRAARIRNKVARVDHHADLVIDNPLSGHFHTRPFVNWFQVGIPSALAATTNPGQRQRAARGVRIVHAPSDPESKGSAIIEAEVAARAGERDIEFVKLVGRPNHEVHEELERCDFVIDELYSDVPGAGLAYEAASHGKPTIVCGYAASELERWVPPDRRLPTHYVHPHEIGQAIDTLLEDPVYCRELGESARSFLVESCSPRDVAARILEAVYDPARRADWSVNPRDLSYLYGTGIREDAARRAVQSVIDEASVAGLQLSDKPELEEAFRRFGAASS